MFGLFRRKLHAKAGIFYPSGYFVTETRPEEGCAIGEIYSVHGSDGGTEWHLDEQEKLSFAPAWCHDYFQYWAEILAFRASDGDISRPSFWIIVVFDSVGNLVAKVKYVPIVEGDEVVDVRYGEDRNLQLA